MFFLNEQCTCNIIHIYIYICILLLIKYDSITDHALGIFTVKITGRTCFMSNNVKGLLKSEMECWAFTWYSCVNLGLFWILRCKCRNAIACNWNWDLQRESASIGNYTRTCFINNVMESKASRNQTGVNLNRRDLFWCFSVQMKSNQMFLSLTLLWDVASSDSSCCT